MVLIFWCSFFLLIYTYIGYAIIVWILAKLKGKGLELAAIPVPEESLPSVAVIICAYNEASIIVEKLQNTLKLDYPSSLLRVVVVADGSDDETVPLVKSIPSVTLLYEPARRGKVAAVNRALKQVKDEIVVFTDANTFLNAEAIKRLVAHYRDKDIAAVAGEKRVIAANAGGAVAGEGLYWKYESALKKLDSRLYSVVGAAGELFSLRTALFMAVPEDTIIEDFVLTMQLAFSGYKVAYEPGAYAIESGSVSIKEEQKRKVRICAGAFQAMSRLHRENNIFKYPLLAFQYISHRVFRWTIAPIALLVLFVANLFIAFNQPPAMYKISMAVQILFYLFGLTGWIFANKDVKIKPLYIPYYFLFMNYSVFLGFARYRKKNQSVLWEKARRA